MKGINVFIRGTREGNWTMRKGRCVVGIIEKSSKGGYRPVARIPGAKHSPSGEMGLH